jgi:hypothetical protein
MRNRNAVRYDIFEDIEIIDEDASTGNVTVNAFANGIMTGLGVHFHWQRFSNGDSDRICLTANDRIQAKGSCERHF